jgi:hypothetical protein
MNGEEGSSNMSTENKPQRPFKVLKQLTAAEIAEYVHSEERTTHLAERKQRVETYKDILSSSTAAAGYLVDRDHKNGPEAHIIYNNSTIEIYNGETKRYITIIAARPGQLKRYFGDGAWQDWQRKLYNKAYYNVINDLHNT